MPKKTSCPDKDWRTSPAPSTRKERVDFKEKCTEWLSSPPPVEEGILIHPSICDHLPRPTPSREDAQREFTLAETRYLPALCLFCDSQDTRLVVANPFAQRSVVAVCGECFRI